MGNKSKVYLLEKQSEEMIAHAFAKTSRSPQTFSDMLKDISEAKSSAFHEKWVLKFGHNSIAEHAILHLAIEGCSRLAIEAIESCRLASYTEQSTRYQPMSLDNVYWSPLWPQDFCKDYRSCMEKLFNLYDILVTETAQHNSFNSPYDIARFALPLSTCANVGMTVNARSLRRTLCKMLASKHGEIIALANEIQATTVTRVPTLLKYVAPCHSMDVLTTLKPKITGKPMRQNTSPFSVKILSHNIDLPSIASALYYEGGDLPFEDMEVPVETINKVLSQQDWHDANYRALEMGTLKLEIESDYGTYYDIKRHRMATIIPQKNMGLDGYLMPFVAFMQKTGLAKIYNETMSDVFNLFNHWKSFSDAVYMLPNAARCRYIIQLTPRQSFAIIKLRGLHEAGHSSYRTVGLKMFEMLKAKWPELYQWLDKFNAGQAQSSTFEREYAAVYPFTSLEREEIAE